MFSKLSLKFIKSDIYVCNVTSKGQNPLTFTHRESDHNNNQSIKCKKTFKISILIILRLSHKMVDESLIVMLSSIKI